MPTLVISSAEVSPFVDLITSRTNASGDIRESRSAWLVLGLALREAPAASKMGLTASSFSALSMTAFLIALESSAIFLEILPDDCDFAAPSPRAD